MKATIFAALIIGCIAASVYFASLFQDLYKFGEIPNYSQEKITDITTEDFVVGQGPAITEKSRFSIHHTTWIYDPAKSDKKGKEIATSYKYTSPITMEFGDGTLMPNWEDEFIGTKEGGKRRFVFPVSKLHQKQKLLFLIPRDAFLLIEFEVLKVF